MTPKHILAFAVVVFVVFLGLVGIIDALEPGHTLTAIEATELGAALAGLTAGALGVVITRRIMDRRQGARNLDGAPSKSDDEPLDD